MANRKITVLTAILFAWMTLPLLAINVRITATAGYAGSQLLSGGVPSNGQLSMLWVDTAGDGLQDLGQLMIRFPFNEGTMYGNDYLVAKGTTSNAFGVSHAAFSAVSANTPSISQNDQFYIIWFDVTPGENISGTVYYGVSTHSSWRLPADGGAFSGPAGNGGSALFSIWGPYVLEIFTNSEKGIVTPNYVYESLGLEGVTDITFSAEPAPGYVFDSWSGDLSGVQNPNTTTFHTSYESYSITANYVPEGQNINGYNSWRLSNFIDMEVGSGMLDDYDGDGITNVMEYFLVLNPKSMNPSSALPQLLSFNGSNARVEYLRNSLVGSTPIAYEYSNDLRSWSTATAGLDYSEIINDHGNGSETITLDFPTAAQRFFFRLSINDGL